MADMRVGGWREGEAGRGNKRGIPVDVSMILAV